MASGKVFAVCTLLAVAGCRFVPTAELQVGTARSRITQTEDQDRVAVAVSIPVRASVEGATFKLNRSGQAVSFDSTPSAALPGGVDLVDESGTFATVVPYQILAAFPTGDTVQKDVSVTLVRSLFAFPTVALAQKSTTPKFIWNTQGLEFAKFQLEVAPESADGYSLLFGKGVSSYDWRDAATSSFSNQPITPRTLVTGVKYTAKVTATAGPADRQEQAVSKTVTFTP